MERCRVNVEIRNDQPTNTCESLEGTPVAFIGVVYEHVSLEFVLPVKGCAADVTLEGLLPTVDQHVHLEVVLSLKPLVTRGALELSCGQGKNTFISQFLTFQIKLHHHISKHYM